MQQLRKPRWRPPNWAFGPVWTFLYCSMGYAAYRVWTELGNPCVLNPISIPHPLNLFLIQLLMNWIWTPIFFGMKHITFVSGYYCLVLQLCLLVVDTINKKPGLQNKSHYSNSVPNLAQFHIHNFIQVAVLLIHNSVGNLVSWISLSKYWHS